MWVPITLAAATFQVLRTSRQHQLGSVLSTNGAGFVRYLYGAPLALIVSAITFVVIGQPVPEIPTRFWFIVALAGTAQILGTVALLRSFAIRDFAVGTVYSKSEVIQVAVIGAVVLAEPLEPLGWGGAVICTVGVAWLAGRGSFVTLLRRAGDPAALMGLAAGGLFGAAAVGIRAASGALGDAPAWNRAVLTLTAMLVIQTLLNGTHLVITDRAQLASTVTHWRLALPVGILSLAGSTGWALAVTLENAARVRTLGQVELLIAFAIARTRLGDRHTRADLAASGLVLLGVLAVVIAG